MDPGKILLCFLLPLVTSGNRPQFPAAKSNRQFSLHFPQDHARPQILGGGGKDSRESPSLDHAPRPSLGNSGRGFTSDRPPTPLFMLVGCVCVHVSAHMQRAEVDINGSPTAFQLAPTSTPTPLLPDMSTHTRRTIPHDPSSHF